MSSDERVDWGKIIKIIVVALGLGVVLYVLAFAIEFLRCFCTCGSAEGDLFPIWSWSRFGYIFGFLALAAILISVVYASCSLIQARNEKGREERKKTKEEMIAEYKTKNAEALDKIRNFKNLIEKIALKFDGSAAAERKNYWVSLDGAVTKLELFNKKIEGKNEVQAEALLTKSCKEFQNLKESARNKLICLDTIEHKMIELVIDCNTVIGEYQYTIDDIYFMLQDNREKDEGFKRIVHETPADSISLLEDLKESKLRKMIAVNLKKLDEYISKANQEYEGAKKVESADERFVEYQRFLQERKNLISDINSDIAKINGIESTVKRALEEIK